MARSSGRLKKQRGSIDRLPSGALRVRVYAGIDPVTKKQHFLKETIEPGPRAEARAEEVRVRLLNQLYEQRHPRTNATVDQMLDRYFKEVELEFNTLETYRGYAKKHIRPLLGKHKVGALDDGIMDSLYVELRRCRDHCDGRRGLVDHRTPRKHSCDERCRPHECRGLAPSTIRQIHFIMSGALRKALKWKWIAVNPITDAEPPAAPRSNPKPPTPQQAATIVNAAFKDPDWGTLIWLTMVTGQRRGELCAIRWRHLDLANGVFHLEKAIGQRGSRTWEKDTKAHQDRRITLDPETVQVLLEHRQRAEARAVVVGVQVSDDSYVFSRTVDGSKHPLPDTVGQRFRNLARRLGIDTSIHKLRHYSATELIAGGVDIRTVAGRLGHGSGGTTTLRTYAAWVSEADQRAAGTLATRMPPRPAAAVAGELPELVPSSPYEEVAVWLRDQILGGTLSPGLPIPSIKKLAATHRVSTSTALRAVRLVAEWGLVEVANGRPTLVRQLVAPAPTEAEPEVAELSASEQLDLEVRHLGKIISTLRAEADPNDTSQLRQLLADAVRRNGDDESNIGTYELVVRYTGERGVATTFVATASRPERPRLVTAPA